MTKEMIREELTKVVKFMRTCEYAWNETRTLKLHDVSYKCDDIVKEYCEKNNKIYGEDHNGDWWFNIFCEDSYYFFKEWAEEEGIDLNEIMCYIGRTSTFFLSDISNVYLSENKLIDANIENLFENIGMDYIYDFINFRINADDTVTINWVDDEYLNDIDYEREMKTLLENVTRYMSNIVKVADYIDDFRENQIEYFTCWVADMDEANEYFETKQKHYSEFPTQDLLNVIEEFELKYETKVETTEDKVMFNNITTIKQLLTR